jgi:ABC-type branched-subunit amino acid transport system substrate-binding protein
MVSRRGAGSAWQRAPGGGRARAAVVAGVLGGLLGGGACGARAPQPSWIEEDAPRVGERHAARPAGSPAAAGDPAAVAASPPVAVAVDVDLAKLAADPARIDALDEPAVLAALGRAGTAAPAARLALRAARLAYHRGDAAQARAMVARGQAAAPAPPAPDDAAVRAELLALGARLAQPAVDPKQVAVLLPLTGRFAAIGAELRLAIQLAPAAGTSWLFLDTRGEADAAAAAVGEAIARGAIAILGPVGDREAIAAARAAALGGIPIALLAPADGADPASGVFRAVGSPADEGRAVARLAAAQGFPTVAVLAPRDDVGQEAADAFTAEARRQKLAVTAQGTYDPTGGNLEPDVKAFLNLVPARNPRLAAHLARHGKKGWTTFSPDIPFSLLYVPDRHDRAALVAAFLPYFGVELRTTELPDPARLAKKHGGNLPQIVQLVGGAGWNHPTLPVRGGAAVQGAMIVDVFPGALGADASAAFAAAFQQRSGRAPTAAAAEVHDAAALIARARAAAAPAAARPGTHASDARAPMRAALARGRLDDGVCGPSAVGPDGELAREPIVLEVAGDQLILAP